MVRKYLTARVLQSIVVIFGAVVITFALTSFIGKPSDVVGAFLNADQRAALDAQYGFGEPILVRFWDYLSGVAVGDFGISYRTRTSAFGMAIRALPYTILLAVASQSAAVVTGMTLAVFSVRRRETVWDRLLRRMIGVFQGLPDFWIAIMLVLILSVRLDLLPSQGFSGPSTLVLPALALAIPLVPSLFRVYRGELLDVLARDFVQALRARGLSERTIMYRHAMPNMLGPGVTFTALQLGYVIGGTILVEVVFAWPGIGNLLFSAVSARDFAVTQSIVVLIALFYVVLNLIADLFHLFSDPRIRVGRA